MECIGYSAFILQMSTDVCNVIDREEQETDCRCYVVYQNSRVLVCPIGYGGIIEEMFGPRRFEIVELVVAGLWR